MDDRFLCRPDIDQRQSAGLHESGMSADGPKLTPCDCLPRQLRYQRARVL